MTDVNLFVNSTDQLEQTYWILRKKYSILYFISPWFILNITFYSNLFFVFVWSFPFVIKREETILYHLVFINNINYIVLHRLECYFSKILTGDKILFSKIKPLNEIIKTISSESFEETFCKKFRLYVGLNLITNFSAF